MPLPVISPMLASTGTPTRHPEAFAYEVKLDGWRGTGLRGWRAEGPHPVRRQVSDSLPELAGLVDALEGRTAILDGELIAMAAGKLDFYSLAPE